MKLGAEKNKVIALGALSLVAAYSIYTNVLSGPDLPPEAQQAAKSPRPSAPAVQGLPEPPSQNVPPRATRERRQAGRSVGQFIPSLAFDPKNRPDPMKVDPTLRLELVAKLQNVTIEGGQRSLFDFSAAPAATPAPKVEVGPVKPPPPKKGYLARAMGPEMKPPDPPKAVEPPKPPPPPIPLKFYGFSSPKTGAKRAFFLEGEDIFVAAEGELIKRRYKVVRIGVNSVVVEDTEHKHQQTLPLEEPPASS
jgi:hypothetical protein